MELTQAELRALRHGGLEPPAGISIREPSYAVKLFEQPKGKWYWQSDRELGFHYSDRFDMYYGDDYVPVVYWVARPHGPFRDRTDAIYDALNSLPEFAHGAVLRSANGNVTLLPDGG